MKNSTITAVLVAVAITAGFIGQIIIALIIMAIALVRHYVIAANSDDIDVRHMDPRYRQDYKRAKRLYKRAA